MALYRISTFDTRTNQFTGSEQRKRIDAAVYVARDMLFDRAKDSAALDSEEHALNTRWLMACLDHRNPLRLDVGRQATRNIRGYRIRIVREA